MGNDELVSVIITAHNTARYLDDCLASITTSTHRNLDIILIDDGSDDATPDIATRWASTDSRVRVRHTEHLGRRAALEHAHGLAAAPILCWVDADDTVEPRAIEHCAARIDSDHQLVYTHRRVIDEHSRVLGPDPRNRITYRPTQLLVDNMIFHLRMFTADLFHRSGGVGDLESAIDWDMNLRMTEHATPVVVPRVLYNYRIRHDRMTGRPDQRRNARVAVENAIRRRGLPYQLHVTTTGWKLSDPTRRANG